MPRTELTGTRIRERRLAMKLRQADLARNVGISGSYLNLIEHNKRRIAGKLLARIAAYLDVDYTELVQGADQALLEAVMGAGAAGSLGDDALTQAEALSRAYPAWAGLIASQAEQVARLERSVNALNDRLTHDPALAEAMHEVLSTVSAVRATASILASTPEIDPNWLGRFHKNLDDDSRRLADGAEAMVSYFETQAKHGQGFSSPMEVVAAFLDANGHYFPDVEAHGIPAIETLCEAGPTEQNASKLLFDALQRYAADAQALPLVTLQKVARECRYDPLEMAATLSLALDCVMRRLACLPPDDEASRNIGLIVIDSSGATRHRRPVPGFTLPLVTAGCPLWPLYQSLGRPHYPVQARLELPDGTLFDATAIALPATLPRPGQPEVIHATMLVRRVTAQANHRQAAGTGLPVGVTCRICPRTACAARREPSLITPQPGIEATAPDLPAF